MLSACRRHPWIAALFAGMLTLALGFGAHAGYMLATRWMTPAPPRVEGWMTPRLVLLNFDLPSDALLPVLGTTAQAAPFTTLDDLAAAQGVGTEALIAEIEQVIAKTGAAP